MTENEDELLEAIIRNMPERISNERTYENVMALVRQHLQYYGSHAGDYPGSSESHLDIMTYGHIQGLKEVLDHFDEQYDGHKAHCGTGLDCVCGRSNVIARARTVGYYECKKCGHNWSDDEYPLAYYTSCPECKAVNDD